METQGPGRSVNTAFRSSRLSRSITSTLLSFTPPADDGTALGRSRSRLPRGHLLQPPGSRRLPEQVEGPLVLDLGEVLVELADRLEIVRAQQTDHLIAPAADLLQPARGRDRDGDN